VSARRLAALAEQLADLRDIVGPSWAVGGGLYHSWSRLFVLQGERQDGDWRRDVAAEAAADGDAGVAAVLEECCLLAQQLVAAGRHLGRAVPPTQRAVLARMSDDVGAALGRLSARTSGQASFIEDAAVATLRQGCALLGHHEPTLMAGLAAQLAVL
jgi:hypothetical protein